MQEIVHYLPVSEPPTEDGKPRVSFRRVLPENLTEAQKVFIEETQDLQMGAQNHNPEHSKQWLEAAKKMWAAA